METRRREVGGHEVEVDELGHLVLKTYFKDDKNEIKEGDIEGILVTYGRDECFWLIRQILKNIFKLRD